MIIWFLWGFHDNININSKLFRNIIQCHNTNYKHSLKILHFNECKDLIKTFSVNKIFNFCKEWKDKCIFFKYFLMYQFGGIYMDLNITSNINFENLQKMYPHGKVFLCSSKVQQIEHYWFASIVPKHKFWKKVIRACEKEMIHKNNSTFHEVLTSVYNEYVQLHEEHDIVLLDPDFSNMSLRHS